MKAENIARVTDSFARRELTVDGLPYRLRAEISNICNLRCTYSKEAFGTCPHWEINKKPVIMQFGFFRKLADELGRYLTHAELYNYGEPFTNPYACDMIRYLKDINPGVIIEMHTNGHFFETDQRRRALLASGLDILRFSVDGISQEAYAKYRIGGDLETVTSSIREITGLKKRMGCSRPFVQFQFILFEHNLGEVPGVKAFAESLGVDSVVFKTDLFDAKPELRERHPAVCRIVSGDQSSDSAASFSGKDEAAGRSFCDFPWVYPTVLADGRVVVCCRDTKYSSVVGTIGGGGFAQVWNGDGYRDFRRRYLEDPVKPFPCCNCGCRPR